MTMRGPQMIFNYKTHIMTPLDALTATLDMLFDLKEEGITVAVVKDDNKRQETIDKYSDKPGHLHHDYWCSAMLKAHNDEQRDILRETLTKISRMGVRFDTGYHISHKNPKIQGSKVLELDWSFRFDPLKSNEDWVEAERDLEELYDQLKLEMLDDNKE